MYWQDLVHNHIVFESATSPLAIHRPIRAVAGTPKRLTSCFGQSDGLLNFPTASLGRIQK
jgi:hypothetical protein